MIKKISALLITVFILLSSLVITGYSYSSVEKDTADALYCLGLFLGTGVNKDGSPKYDLDNELTRGQSIVLLIRMLGKEAEVLEGSYTHPFKDTVPWYDKQVGYAYKNGLTKGTSKKTYSGTLPTTAEMFATFCLRALGYVDGDENPDFNWYEASIKAEEIGINVNTEGDKFTRADAVITFWDTLNAKLKDSEKTLAESLIEADAFTSDQFAEAKQILGITDPPSPPPGPKPGEFPEIPLT